MSSRRRDEGSVTVWLAVMVVAILAAAGLVYDGGEALGAKGRAIADAYGAARAGADALDRAALAQGGPPVPDRGAAQLAARRFLIQAGVDPTRAVVAVTGDAVTVQVSIRQPTRILGVVGIGDLTVSGHGSARPLYGLTAAAP
jgi:hypothetical protein